MNLLNLIYPDVCEVCGRSLLRGEEVMCLHCSFEMPYTHAHRSEFNEVHRRLASTLAIEKAASMFYYYKGSPYVDIIHRAKYQHRPVILRKMARIYSATLKESLFFDGMDAIVPVPLHVLKLIKRGYNQSEYIARGISDVTGLPVLNSLKARRSHSSQTTKGSFSRWINALNVYAVKNADSLSGKHVLVVDDVITTGATVLSCVKVMKDAVPDIKVSVLSLGLAHLA